VVFLIVTVCTEHVLKRDGWVVETREGIIAVEELGAAWRRRNGNKDSSAASTMHRLEDI
jgi:hypothetical protein